jgi:uncharacterized protein (DUF1501 family)
MAAVTPLKLNAPDLQQFQTGDFVPYNFGGTGQTSVTTGDLLYGSASNVWSRLGIGTTGQVLTVVAGLPAWSTSSATTSATVIIPLTNGSGGTINQGQAVYFNGVNDTVALAEANAIGTSRCIGFVYDATIANTATGNIIVQGLAPAVLSSATAGTVYYLSDATAGATTVTAPSTSGHCVAPVGIAADATNLFIKIDTIVRL